MKKTYLARFAWAILVLCGIFPTAAQKMTLTPEEFAQRKAARTLPASFDVLSSAARTPIKPPIGPAGVLKGGGFNNCDCWIEPDASYTTQTTWPLGSANEDDGSYGPISLPFNFNLYGDLYNAFYLNINGNVSFLFDYFTFTPDGFPNPDFIMVAPFWADVELTSDPVGTIKWKVTPTAVYVNWTDVGYYFQHTDKRNSFQLIITDGTGPVIGVGKNVSFCPVRHLRSGRSSLRWSVREPGRDRLAGQQELRVHHRRQHDQHPADRERRAPLRYPRGLYG
jgi:hypothetical protein